MAERILSCEQCNRQLPSGELGWRALHGREDDDTVVTVIFCPECHEQEFGEPDPSLGEPT